MDMIKIDKNTIVNRLDVSAVTLWQKDGEEKGSVLTLRSGKALFIWDIAPHSVYKKLGW